MFAVLYAHMCLHPLLTQTLYAYCIPLCLHDETVPAGPTVSEGVNPLARMRAASRQGSPEPQKPVYDDFGNIVRATADNGQPPSGGGGFQNPLARGRQNPRGSTAGNGCANGFGSGAEEAVQPRVTSTGDLFSLAPEKMPRRSISSGSLLSSSLNGSRRGSTASATASTTSAAAPAAAAANDAVVAAAAAKVAAAAVAPVKQPDTATTTSATVVKDVPVQQQSVVKPTTAAATTSGVTDNVASKDSATAGGSSVKATQSPTSTSAASSAGTTPTSATAAAGASFGGKSWNRRRSDRDDNVTITYDQYGKSHAQYFSISYYDFAVYHAEFNRDRNMHLIICSKQQRMRCYKLY
jgi:hypothetical protein